jgi:hypothetical protein
MFNPIRHRRAHQQHQVRHHAKDSDTDTFFDLLTGPDLLNELESTMPEYRDREFPPSETLSMFIDQALSADRSCQNVVNRAAVKRLAEGAPVCSTNTGGYCRARKRLPMEMVSHLSAHTGRAIAARTPEPWRWRGRAVRLVDGTTVSLPDTPANQAAYPQPRSQCPGLGFPLCRVVGVLCLASGTVLNAAIGPYRGKGADEQTLLRSILDTLDADDIVVGDALYASYFLFCALQAKGVDAVFEQHGSRRRSTDFRRGRRLGTRDHLIRLDKPKQKPDWMSEAGYASVPDNLTVRETRTGGKTLVSTLVDPKAVSKTDLKLLYKSRWHVELDLRQIKTTLGMDTLTCKTPAMAEKEIWVYLLAYNLIRLMMAQAAVLANTTPRQLSFKHTLQLLVAWRQQPRPGGTDDWTGLFVLIAQQPAGHRPGRIEPRAVKRRPKPFPLLRKPRAEARQQIRKHGHPRKLK